MTLLKGETLAKIIKCFEKEVISRLESGYKRSVEKTLKKQKTKKALTFTH
jgi:hypothetical protein